MRFNKEKSMSKTDIKGNVNAAGTVAAEDKTKTMSYMKKQETKFGWIFVAPMCIGFVLFILFPLVYAIVMSFSDYDLVNWGAFGLQNYTRMFSDVYFTTGLKNAVIYALGGPVGTFVALIISAMLVSIKKGSLFYRMIFYLPTLCGAVAITFIWQWMYATDGILIQLLQDLGIYDGAFKFLDQYRFVPSMMIMGVWSGFGISVLMFYANLHNISQALYESASLDGANAFHKFIHITLPAISPTMFYIIITGIIGALQVFTQFQVMAAGSSPEYMSPVWHIYNLSFGGGGGEFGYASAMGVFLGLVIMVVTIIQFVVSKLWVSYD